MKAVLRRLSRVEEKLIPRVDVASQRDAEVARERRRRLEASGETYEPLDWGSLNLVLVSMENIAVRTVRLLPER
jgi:hypothetical protein